jgi:hypothetical protein
MINALCKLHDKIGTGLMIDDDIAFTKPELKNYQRITEKNKFYAQII